MKLAKLSMGLVLLYSVTGFTMAQKLPHEEPTTDYKESSTGNCQALADFAKNPVWDFKGAPGTKADYIMADKKRRLVHLLKDGEVLRSYKMALGGTPTGDKKCEGDGKTPEGLYNIGYKNSASSFHLSLAVSYPNQDDINEARKLGCSPGGDIMVHGLPNERWKWPFIRHPRDWTKGCMAVTNGEIEEIWALVDKGTPIEICK